MEVVSENVKRIAVDSSVENANSKVLVTGASGFLAIHCVQQLLSAGYQVRGTVRDLGDSAKIQPLNELGHRERLQLFVADLHDSQIWNSAVADCEYILHIASPCELVPTEGIVETAVQGTVNVLAAAARCPTVKKVVLTSSCGAINEGYKDPKKVFTEDDWTKLSDACVHAYHRSKTLAERAAWKFVHENLDVKFQLTVFNPGLLVGPLLQNRQGASAKVIGRFVDGSMPAYPSMKMALVDVRDVARAHVLALTNNATNGQRILLTANTLSYAQIAKIARREFRSKGYRIPRLKAPYSLLWLYSRFDDEARQALKFYGHEEYFDNSKARDLLGLTFNDPAISIVDMIYDMIERGMLTRRATSS